MAPNLLNPNVNRFPFWQRPAGIQVPNLIPGQQMTGEIQDIRLNRIPLKTDFNNGDVRKIPFPQAPNNDVSSARDLLTHQIPQGRGAGVGLMDMLQTSIVQQQNQGGENGA